MMICSSICRTPGRNGRDLQEPRALGGPDPLSEASNQPFLTNGAKPEPRLIRRNGSYGEICRAKGSLDEPLVVGVGFSANMNVLCPSESEGHLFELGRGSSRGRTRKGSPKLRYRNLGSCTGS